MQANFYIYKKEVDWSVLHQGFTIPVSIQIAFRQLIKNSLPRGTSKNVKMFFDNQTYEARLVNQKFDEQKYPNHQDIIQFRYEPNSEIANKMRSVFSSSFNYFSEFKANNVTRKYRKRPVPVSEEQKEHLIVYTTQFEDTFLLEHFTVQESRKFEKEVESFDEDEFEMAVNYEQKDLTARIERKPQLVKIRKLDKSICDNLKLLYKHRCQITSENFCEHYGVSVVEAHHIDYFTKSLNNNSDNILIVSPNYHRLIHKLNPIFDRKNLAFIFPNGLREAIKTNLHL
jgi:5-methylcytosine-specific restriction enzyme A